jgi:aspartate aminotransferase-like enzyme
MPIADPQLPVRLLAGGGPSSPDSRVLRALTTPLIGQFDPDFTAVMDDVVQLGRSTFLTRSPHCFAVSALASGGLEAVLNSLIESPRDKVAILGSPCFVNSTAEIVRRYSAESVPSGAARLLIVPLLDPFTGTRMPVEDLARTAHAQGASIVVEATCGLAAVELRVDEWDIDVCVAGVDYAVGAPSGMSLVTYQPEIAARLQRRASPPTTSYLDLVQLQAYWSPERLNHHTAPTSLVYGLREALRLIQLEGLAARWERHATIANELRGGLQKVGLEPHGDLPYAIVEVPPEVDEPRAWRRLIDDFGVHVTRVEPRAWRLGLLGADARPEAMNQLRYALESVLRS